jgi:hypothetical protein
MTDQPHRRDSDPALTHEQHKQFDPELDLDELKRDLAHTRDINNMGPEPSTDSRESD